MLTNVCIWHIEVAVVFCMPTEKLMVKMTIENAKYSKL